MKTILKKWMKLFRAFVSGLRPLPTALAVFAFLVLLVFFVERPRLSEQEATTFVFPRFEALLAVTVEIQSPAGDWRYEKGDLHFPQPLLEALESLKIEQAVSQNPGKQSLYGVDDIHATHLLIKDRQDQILAELYLGSENALGHQYMRRPQGLTVYEVSPSLKSLLPLPDLGRNW